MPFHSTRHTFVSKLGEGGVADEIIMGLAGHSARKMLERYSKSRMESKRSAVASLTSIKPPANVSALSGVGDEAIASEEASSVN